MQLVKISKKMKVVTLRKLLWCSLPWVVHPADTSSTVHHPLSYRYDFSTVLCDHITVHTKSFHKCTILPTFNTVQACLLECAVWYTNICKSFSSCNWHTHCLYILDNREFTVLPHSQGKLPYYGQGMGPSAQPHSNLHMRELKQSHFYIEIIAYVNTWSVINTKKLSIPRGSQ
jgi:hypothetical protein